MKTFALLPASDEIRGWCLILEQEMMCWTGVKMNHVFGTRAFYHRKVMFAMLPDRRSLDSSTAISFRAPRKGSNEDADWRSFELSGPNLLDTALGLLREAYRDSVVHPFAKAQFKEPRYLKYWTHGDREIRAVQNLPDEPDGKLPNNPGHS
jgi:hypothetical protein